MAELNFRELTDEELDQVSGTGIKEIAACILDYLYEHPEENIGINYELYNAIIAQNWLLAVKLVSEAVKQDNGFVKACTQA